MYSLIYFALLGWLAVKYSVLFGVVSLGNAIKAGLSLVITLTVLSIVALADVPCSIPASTAGICILLSSVPPATGKRPLYAPITVYVLSLRLMLTGCTAISVATFATQLLCHAILLRGNG